MPSCEFCKNFKKIPFDRTFLVENFLVNAFLKLQQNKDILFERERNRIKTLE